MTVLEPEPATIEMQEAKADGTFLGRASNGEMLTFDFMFRV